MPAPSSLARRALAALLLSALLALPSGAAVATTASFGRQVPSSETAPSTAGAASTSPAPVATGDDDEAAQDQADADLWAVWRIVIALGGVTLALVGLLVLYVRATSPRRATRRAAARAAADDEDVVDPPSADDAPARGGADETDRPLVAAGPARRTKRVEAPAKKLATPDAERVLIRPGQAPVRVPPAGARTDGSPPPAPSGPSAPPADR